MHSSQRRITITLFLCAALLVNGSQVTAAGPIDACPTQESSTVPPARLAALARGFNLPGWLDSATPQPPDPAVLATLHARGFTHIRLPVDPDLIMEELSGPTEASRKLAELDGALRALTRIGFVVTLDIHPGNKFGRLHAANPSKGLAALEDVWRMLAHRYHGYELDRIFFEPLNEPTVAAEIWSQQGPKLVSLIRRHEPNRTIIYGHADYQRIDALEHVAPLADANVVYAAHFYDPMIFTHQGLDWSDDPLRYLHDVPFPAALTDISVTKLLRELVSNGRVDSAALLNSQLDRAWTQERIETDIAVAGAWMDRHRRPIIINEFGVLRWKAPPADRARWLSTVRRSAERHCIGWTHWDYADAFGLVRRMGRRELPDEAVMRALLEGDSRSSRTTRSLR
jgi:endoglucanase